MNAIAPGDQFQRIQISAELTRWLLTTIFRQYSPSLATVRHYSYYSLFGFSRHPLSSLLRSRLSGCHATLPRKTVFRGSVAWHPERRLRRRLPLKRPSHDKLKVAKSCRQTRKSWRTHAFTQQTRVKSQHTPICKMAAVVQWYLRRVHGCALLYFMFIAGE